MRKLRSPECKELRRSLFETGLPDPTSAATTTLRMVTLTILRCVKDLLFLNPRSTEHSSTVVTYMQLYLSQSFILLFMITRLCLGASSQHLFGKQPEPRLQASKTHYACHAVPTLWQRCTALSKGTVKEKAVHGVFFFCLLFNSKK